MINKVNIYTMPKETLTKGLKRGVAFGSKMTFAFYEGEKDALKKGSLVHSHPYEQATLFLKGRARLTIEGEQIDVGPGDLYFVPPNAEHGAETLEGPSAAIDFFTPPRNDMREGVDPVKLDYMDLRRDQQ